MLYEIFDISFSREILLVCLLLTFLTSCISLKLMQNVLPRDGGRAFAVNGGLSQGKPRGAGIVFISIFSLFTLVFMPYSNELLIYVIMIFAAMITGYLDDSSKKPWGELKKGILDLVISLVCAFTYVNFNSSNLHIMITGTDIELPSAVFIILATLLIWVSINVTNCSDGVDGLSGSLSIVSLVTFYIIFSMVSAGDFAPTVLVMVVCILGYLWFNASPSKLLMGDAGSRAIGVFIAVTALKTGSPLLFIPVAAVFIVDGGLGLIKVTLIRCLKNKNIMKNIRTPLHDHARKNKGWSDTQTVFRFVIIQIVISSVLIYLI